MHLVKLGANKSLFFSCIAGRVRDIVGQQRDENEMRSKFPRQQTRKHNKKTNQHHKPNPKTNPSAKPVVPREMQTR